MQPVDLPALARGTGVALLAIAALFAIIFINEGRVEEKNRGDSLAAQVAANQAKQDCRSALSTAVTDATTTYQFALGQDQLAQDALVVALAQGGDIAASLQAIETAGASIDRVGRSLDQARKTRVAFEQDTSQECPANPSAPSSGHRAASPTTVGTDTTTTTAPATTTTGRRARRPSTTTSSRPPTSHPSTTSTTVFHSSPVPTEPLCELVPGVTVPQMLPCL